MPILPSFMVEALAFTGHPRGIVDSMRPDETELWRVHENELDDWVCVMISCCTGAELQVRQGTRIILRELYPDKATLYERAAELRAASGGARAERSQWLQDGPGS